MVRAVDGLKVCIKCGLEQSVEEFDIQRDNVDGRTGRCKRCRREYNNNYYRERKKDPEYRARVNKWAREQNAKERETRANYFRHLKRTFGMTEDDYNWLLKLQKYCCGICHRHDDCPRGVLFVDHDKETDVVCGLLCSTCNTGIGCLHHDPDWLREARHYCVNTRGYVANPCFQCRELIRNPYEQLDCFIEYRFKESKRVHARIRVGVLCRHCVDAEVERNQQKSPGEQSSLFE